MIRKILTILALLMLSGCQALGNAIEDMSEGEKQAAVIIGAVLVTGAIVANQRGDTIVVNECHPHGHCP